VQLLRLALVDPTDRILKGVEARSVVPAVRSTTRAFPLLLPPSPSFLFQRPPSPPPWRNEIPRLRSWKLKPNPTAIREGRTERKTALETTGNIIRKEKRTYNPGDLVFLSSRNINTIGPSKKLDDKVLGPFRVLKAVGTSYRLPPYASMTFSTRACSEKLRTIPYQDRQTSRRNLRWWTTRMNGK
jgi:hypothetical protein